MCGFLVDLIRRYILSFFFFFTLKSGFNVSAHAFRIPQNESQKITFFFQQHYSLTQTPSSVLSDMDGMKNTGIQAASVHQSVPNRSDHQHSAVFSQIMVNSNQRLSAVIHHSSTVKDALS